MKQRTVTTHPEFYKHRASFLWGIDYREDLERLAEDPWGCFSLYG